MKSIKNKGIKLVVSFFLVMMVLDVWTTLRFRHLITYLEANPIYSYVGLPGIIALNLLLIYFSHRWYCRSKSPWYRYYILTIILIVSLLRISVVSNNYEGQEVLSELPEEKQLEIAKSVTPEMKKEAYVQVYTPAIAPLFIVFLVFLLYKLDHKIERRDNYE